MAFDSAVSLLALIGGFSGSTSPNAALRRWGWTLAVAGALLACTLIFPDRLTTAGHHRCSAARVSCKLTGGATTSNAWAFNDDEPIWRR